MAEAAVDLVMPEGKAGPVGQVLGLVHEPRAQASGVHLLQRDQIVPGDRVSDRVQVGPATRVRQHVAPAPRQVVPVALGGNPSLDVIAEQPQGDGPGPRRSRLGASEVDPRGRVDIALQVQGSKPPPGLAAG